MSRAVASLADVALLAPAGLLLLVYLLALRQPRLAAAWALAFGAAGAITLGAKLLFHACGGTITDLDVESPSGHVSAAIVFYGSLALLFGAGRSDRIRRGLAIAVGLIVVAVGASRIRTGAHTPLEVLIGLAIGSVALGLFAALGQPRPLLPWRPAAAGFVVALLLLGGLHIEFERSIGRYARQLSAAFDVCRPSEQARAFDLPSRAR